MQCCAVAVCVCLVRRTMHGHKAKAHVNCQPDPFVDLRARERERVREMVLNNTANNTILYNYRFLPGFAPFVDGTVIANSATSTTSPLTLPTGSAIAR